MVCQAWSAGTLATHWPTISGHHRISSLDPTLCWTRVDIYFIMHYYLFHPVYNNFLIFISFSLHYLSSRPTGVQSLSLGVTSIFIGFPQFHPTNILHIQSLLFSSNSHSFIFVRKNSWCCTPPMHNHTCWWGAKQGTLHWTLILSKHHLLQNASGWLISDHHFSAQVPA